MIRNKIFIFFLVIFSFFYNKNSEIFAQNISSLFDITKQAIAQKWFQNPEHFTFQNLEKLPTDIQEPLQEAIFKPKVHDALEALVYKKDSTKLKQLPSSMIRRFINQPIFTEDPNYKYDGFNEDKNSALHISSYLGNTHHVKELIALGADVNGVNTIDQTPMMYMATQGGDHEINNRLEIIKLLVESGADINAVNKHNATAIKIAALNGNLSLTKALLPYDPSDKSEILQWALDGVYFCLDEDRKKIKIKTIKQILKFNPPITPEVRQALNCSSCKEKVKLKINLTEIGQKRKIDRQFSRLNNTDFMKLKHKKTFINGGLLATISNWYKTRKYKPQIVTRFQK